MFGKQKKLPAQAAVGMTVANRYHQMTQSSVRPTQGAEGAVLFNFGATEPNIVCAPLEVCDIALQPAEQVSSILVGDSARWQLEPAVSGVAPFERQHIVVKPADVGLETSLIITTDKRTYHIRLLSRRTDYMPSVAFTYPDEVVAKWQALRAHTTAVNTALNKVISESSLSMGADSSPTGGPTSAYLSNLDFNYAINGRAAWKPVRVYNDGIKTIIEMPAAMAQTEAPALLVVRKGGSIKNTQDTTIVNYRVQNGRFIVDQIFEQAVLVAGVGGKQERITITRAPRPA
jgi:type IV secretion system protein VirB9